MMEEQLLAAVEGIGDSEIESPLHVGSPSKQTVYIVAGETSMSPKLQYNDFQSSEYVTQTQTSKFMRNTQPTFQIALSKTNTEMRVETPTLSTLKKKKDNSNQKDLLRQITNTQERRPHNVYHNQQPAARRFRNTSTSFITEQSSSKPESVHKLGDSPHKRGNDDLADVSIKKDKVNNKKVSIHTSRKQRYRKAAVSLAHTRNAPFMNTSFNSNLNVPQLTNLAQAYTEGVTQLIKTLPFMQTKLKPIVSQSLDLKTLRAANQKMQQKQAPHPLRNMLQGSQESQTSLPSHGPLRKSVRVPHQSNMTNDSYHQNSGQLNSNRSLSNVFPHNGIQSSVFRVEQAQDYTDLKLDFTSKPIMTEHQSQNIIETLANANSQGQKLRIKSKLVAPEGVGIITQSQPDVMLPAMMPKKPQQLAKGSPRIGHQHETSTERRILGILDRADYHKLREHRSHHGDSNHDNCTCFDHLNSQKKISQSIDQSMVNHVTQLGYSTQYRLSSSPVESFSSTKKKSPKVPRNVLSIQLRPLKGKAEHQREYRSMIEQEYGKEKKKQIYETMYSGVSRSPEAKANSSIQHLIQLNLRSEQKNEPYKATKRNAHVRLQTISPRCEVIEEKLVKIDDKNAEMMNTTTASFSVNSVAGQSTLRHSTSRWRPQQMTSKQFFLFSPNDIQLASKSRYGQAMQCQTDEVGGGLAGSNSNSIVDLQIKTSDPQIRKVKKHQGNQINLGYQGAHEQDLAKEYLNYLMQDNEQNDHVVHDSHTELVSQSHLPFGRIYSQMSKEHSKQSMQQRKTPKLASSKEEPVPDNGNIVQPEVKAYMAPIANKRTPRARDAKQIEVSPKRQAVTRKPTEKISKDNKEEGKTMKRANNSSLLNIAKSVSPRANELQIKEGKLVAKKPSQRSVKAAPIPSKKPQVVKVKKQQPFVAHEDPSVQLLLQKETNSCGTKSDVNSLTNYQEAEQISDDDMVNPLDEYERDSLFALEPSRVSQYGRLDRDLFSNPTEVDVNMQMRSAKDWELQKKRQQDYIAQKKQDIIESNKKFGPLERKPIKLVKPNNHHAISNITQISGFYEQKQQDEYESGLTLNSPFGSQPNQMQTLLSKTQGGF